MDEITAQEQTETGEQTRAASGQAESAQPAPAEESFDALIRGRYREAFAAKLREVLGRQAQAQRSYLAYQRLRVQEAQARGEHPSLSLEAELDNPDFIRLLQSGVGLKTAYEAIHHRELMEAQAASRAQTQRQLQKRPVENALGETAAIRSAVEPAAMSAKERRQLRRRAERGERITF